MAPSRRRLLSFSTVVLTLAAACADPEVEHQHSIAESPLSSVISVGGLTYEREVVDPQSPFNPWMKNIGKFDGDDLPDLLVAGSEGPVVWYQAPDWTKRTISSSASSESGSDVGDIDGDGDIDVVVGKVWYENNNGGSSWTPHPLPSGPASTHDVVVADVNGDGKLDIAMRGQSQSVIGVYLQDSPTSWTVFGVEPGLGLNGLDVADVNGDGRRDIVVGGVWMENPGGNIATTEWDQHVFASGWNSYASVKVIDMDNDGRNDIVLSVSEEVGDLAWFKAPADPENGTWTRNTVATGLGKVHCFAVVDINHDGQLDIAASEFDGAGRLIVYLRNGSGWTANELGRDALHNLRAGDIDNDGDIDLFGAYCFGTVPVILYRNLEDGGVPTSAPPTVATAASASPSTVTGTTTALSALGADDNGEAALSYTWSTTGSPPGSVSFAPNGNNAASSSTATFSRAGSYTLQVTIWDGEGQSVVSTVNVIVSQTLTSAAVTPTTATVVTGGTQAFAASARDQFAQPMSSQPSFSWSVSGGGTINSSGVFTAGGTGGGPFTVTATSGSSSATASVTVSATVPTTTFGETNITSTDDGNNSGLLVAQQATVSQGGTLQTLSFYVTQAAGKLRLGLYSANGPNGGPGTKLAETAELTPVAGWNTAAVTTQVNLTAGTYWLAYLTNSNSLRFRHATSGSGKWYSVTYGTMPATYATNPQGGAYHWSFYGTVGTGSGPTNQAPTVATSAAATPSPVTASSTSLTVLGADDAGESGLSYAWATTGSPPAAVSFSANGSNAAKSTTATFTRAGSYSFLVTITDAQGLSTTSSVSVTVNQTLTSITVAPGTASVEAGATQSFTATGRDQFSQTMSATVSWSVSGGGSINSSGLFTAGGSAGGPFTVTATSGARSGTASVTVTAVVPVNQAPTIATAAAATPSTVTDSATSLSALGADDGGEGNLSYTWATTGSPPAAVFFNANGTNAAKNVIAVFSRAGSYTLRVTIADAQGLSVTSTVTVTVNQTLTSITVAPTSASVAAGASQTFVATGRDQFNQTMSATASWTVSGGGSINSSGVFTAGPTEGGPFTVTATSGARSGTASVTVTAVVPVNQAPTVATAAAASPSPVTASSTSLTVLGADDAGEGNLSYTWATTGSPPAAVSFSANGSNAAKSTTATFTRAGSYSLRATITDAQGLSVTSSVTVTVSQTLTSITVAPSGASVATGASQTFVATARDQFSQTMTATATWTVSGGGTINSSGVFTAGATAGGPFTVTATSGARSGTASVTVTAGSATSTIGETTVLGEDDGNNVGLIVAQQVTLAQAKNAVSMSFYVTQAAGNLRLGIYRADGSGGGPGTKVAETAEFAPTTGWNTRNVVSSVSLPAGNYWLAYMPSSGSLRFRMARSGSGTWANQSYGAMPATFPSGRSSGAFHWSFYATVQ